MQFDENNNIINQDINNNIITNDNTNNKNTFSNNTPDIIEKWEHFGIKESLLKGIYGTGFITPSFIQKVAIKPMMMGKDLRAQAQSGTGKTGAFAVGALQSIDETIDATQVLVLVSTREIAEQNAMRIAGIGMHMNIKVTLLCGGFAVSENISSLSQNPGIVVGTPGRVLHMIQANHLKTENIKLLIIDEADEMLKQGFKDKVKAIFLTLPVDILQVAMFSATWEKEELDVAAEILRNPVIIDLRQDEQTLKGIDQYYVYLGPKPARGSDMLKVDALVDILESSDVSQCVIFVNTKSKAKYLYDVLCTMKFPVEVIHSEFTQQQRTDILNRFRASKFRYLLSTGLLGRGIDIQQLSLVINFDIPRSQDIVTYIHRIGRAGRYGRKGKALNFVFDDDLPVIQEIEKHFHTSIGPMPQNETT
ncbi:DEAD/DEAH box helicase [Hamiltosporidium tvaerminnensis]|uniref:RNA helicase n=1 Tax=Hamiltosporidium tvaerminnensis TaxID=1176355 RepID=A0A4Q9M268_9MICR|nr:DEAD/DEAH box helicase [Hamiltosporidium tvaerminnensis]